MHHIHTTPGFIIQARAYGEAGKMLSIFTRDYGLVLATAQGIRLEKSKLRYHTQEYSFGDYSLVRGREFWRLTSAQGKHDLRFKIQDLRKSQELLARIALILKRLLHGEEAHPELFEIVDACKKFLDLQMELSDEQMKTLESLVVLRMLAALGYIGNDAMIDVPVKSGELTVALIDSCAAKRVAINQHINKALRESQM